MPLGKVENFEKVEMEFKEKKKRFDPNIVYKNKTNPTKI
jgi:phosphoribosyl-AMP cyclohydrolase